MEIVAHRGYAAKYPENTIEACEAAVKAGARWVEVDVQLDKGVPVLAHDMPKGGEPTLAQFAEWLDSRDVSAMVELKKASIEAFGADAVVSAVMAVMRGRWHPISFDYEALRLAVELGAPAPGWIVCKYNQRVAADARAIGARWLITNRDFLQPGPVPSGWEWVVYEVATAEQARDLMARGVRWLETMDVELIAEALRAS